MFRVLKIALLTTTAIVSTAGAWAAQPTTAQAQSLEARARAHIVALPGFTMHGAGQGYAMKDVMLDDDGESHVRFDREYRGLRVIGGDMVVHMDRNGNFRSSSLTLNRLLMLGVRPSVAETVATAAGLAGRDGYAASGRPQLIVYARGDIPVLAYDVFMTGEQPDGTPSELHVIVDAHRGVVLETWDDIHTADGFGKGFFNGTVALATTPISGGYSLKDPTRGGQYTIDMGNKQGGNGSLFTDADNTWGDGTLSNRQTVGVDAQYGTAVTWDYYKNVHGRTGIANDGKGAYNRVHYGRSYNNAYWSDSCFCMTYGDGDGKTFNPFDSLDVAGHEMSHGVTSRTAGLTYSGESGGLNEATSDIFGTMVEYYAANSSDTPDYLIGEKLYKTGGKALRYMFSPNKDGASADCWYSGLGSLDVHYSSGVANHFYFLLAEGTSSGATVSPTCQAGDTKKATGSATLSGIGRAAAEKIWFKALTVYMTSSTNYADARVASLKAAADLFGVGSVQAAAVTAAWSAVNVN